MKNWKAILGVVLVFTLGMMAGGLVTAGFIRHRVRTTLARGTEGVADVIVRRLSIELRLDAAQRGQLRTIVHDGQQEAREARRQIEEVVAESEVKVRAILRPDQLERFDRLVAKRKANWKSSGN